MPVEVSGSDLIFPHRPASASLLEKLDRFKNVWKHEPLTGPFLKDKARQDIQPCYEKATPNTDAIPCRNEVAVC